ncbi:hypothetical protein [Tahibacter amnicola]|uniref:Glucosyltransferase GtrII-like protein n=1 Tax=Tahibacter amnicola TaxID=2976241 RepID=A0ABY6BN32_9GAMM|nr:hypothetical protein [Tahibacter amnicola]UXI69222.1 hypothetical protein N4264_06125 [Tahibacter amnicola]
MNAIVETSMPLSARLRGALENRTVQVVVLAVVTLLVLLYRRPDQFSHPYMWGEDGVVNTVHYAQSGWASLWQPVAGYYTLPIKLIYLISSSLSFRWFPEISLWLTTAFTFASLAAVAFAPTLLRWRWLCAVAVLLIPTGAENFAVSLFAGWWGSILALLALLWNTEQRRTGLRLGLLFVGALSTPLIIAIAPLFALRLFWYRHRDEVITVVAAALLAGLQLYALTHSPGPPKADSLGYDTLLMLEKFFGYYTVVSLEFVAHGWIQLAGAALVVFIAAAGVFDRRSLGMAFALLALALAANILISIVRTPLPLVHPVVTTPRYFFFPYLLTSWMLIQLAAVPTRVTQVIAILALALGVRNAVEHGQHRHEPIDWRAHVDSCTRSPTYQLPVHTVGLAASTWSVSLTGEQCRQMVQRSLFDNQVTP